MVERGGLENRCTRKRTEGSNPSLSATIFQTSLDFTGLQLLLSAMLHGWTSLVLLAPSIGACGSAQSGVLDLRP